MFFFFKITDVFALSIFFTFKITSKEQHNCCWGELGHCSLA